MKRGSRLGRYLAASLTAALLLAGCGGNGDGDTDPAPSDGTSGDTGTDGDGDGDDGPDGDGASEGLSLPDLRMSYAAERASILMSMIGAKERTWDDTFDEVELLFTTEGIPALISDAVWAVMDEPAVLWPALDQGLFDGVLVANFNDLDNWYLCAKAEIEEPEDLIGATYTGGEIGNVWNVVGRIIMEQELGIDADQVNFVSIGGSTDAWVDALLAGQVDASQCQPRHLPLMEEAGFNVLFQEQRNLATEMILVQRETWENNRDAVCAMVEGLFEFRQWIQDTDEEDWSDKIPEVKQFLEDNGFDVSEDGLAIDRNWETTQQQEFNWAMDMGTPAEAWDLQYELLSREGGEISPDFEWRDHVALDCVWELQEAAGLPLNPDPSDL